MKCQYCNTKITISTSYSVPVVTPAPKQAYGAPIKSSEVSTDYSCRSDSCKQQLRQAHGVRGS